MSEAEELMSNVQEIIDDYNRPVIPLQSNRSYAHMVRFWFLERFEREWNE